MSKKEQLPSSQDAKQIFGARLITVLSATMETFITNMSEENFTAEVKVIGQYKTLYDQAGLMVRQDEITWLKCGIEFVDGVQHISAVVTRDYSDWSVVPLVHHPTFLWLRVKREGPAIEVKYSLDGEQYTMLRLSYLTEAETLQVGVMCASPEGDGFPITFEEFKLDTHPRGHKD